MRPELEQIEKIDQYLRGELPAADKAAFEKQMAGNEALREEVTLQQDIMNGIDRILLKEKVQLAVTRYRWRQKLTNWGIWGAVIVAIFTIAFYYKSTLHKPGSRRANNLPEYNERGEKLWVDADRYIPAQTFMVDVSMDTVIETRGGIVLAIAANSFLDENNNAANGKVELIVKEALDPASIITGGLATRSGDQLLESGGMFYFDARKEGKPLKIDQAKSIYAEVPTDTVKPGMQVFSGQRRADGTIDWVYPKPLVRDLVAVDIKTLDFYPPHYLDSLQHREYDINNKYFTDSLYYSFAKHFWHGSSPSASEKAEAENETSLSDSIQVYGDRYFIQPCGINPAKIKAIWNDQFQNTILATREFEERLYWIHKTDNEVLDLYIKNLDKSLSFIDSIAASKMSGQYRDKFMAFAARNEGQVSNRSAQFEMLAKYYENKTRAFTEAIAKTQNEFWSNQGELDIEAMRRESGHDADTVNRQIQLFREEFQLNLEEAYRQLGNDTLNAGNRQWNSKYPVQVTNTGWLNVDKYVYESTLSRNTLDYTDPKSGKKAVINYLPFSIQVKQWKEYDRLYVYLLPDKLSSFMRLNGEAGKYTEKLNALIQYQLVCVAYKNEQAYLYSESRAQSKQYSNFILSPVSTAELNQRLNSMGSLAQASAIIKENEFYLFKSKDEKRREYNMRLRELEEEILKMIFPCKLDSLPVN